MNYQDTISWMFQRLPMYQNQGKSAYKEDLDNTILLANYLNNPEKQFRSIHVGGTNGKGSTSHILASILQEAGYKVGLYTSPHLKDFRERIKINGEVISKHFVIGFIKKHKSFFETNTLSFFEMTVGMAFDYFARQNVDIAVIEVGLGGRLDSTNIITPEVSVITNIGLDHQQFLGNTIEKIAVEKAGIIKPNIPIVIGETQSKTEPVFNEFAKNNNSRIVYADKVSKSGTYTSDLKGDYQIKNIKTALAAVDELNTRGFNISETNKKKGLISVVKNTGLNGRWQVLQKKPKIVCDTAHNTEGLTYVVAQLKRETFNNLHIVFGAVNDKDLSAILSILPKTATYYFCKPNVLRGLDTSELMKLFLSNGFKGEAYNSVDTALEAAKQRAAIDDLIYVGGSIFVVAEII